MNKIIFTILFVFSTTAQSSDLISLECELTAHTDGTKIEPSNGG